MKTVSFTFELYDLFFPEDKHGTDFTYARWPMSVSKKKWGAQLTPLLRGMCTLIVEYVGINRTREVQNVCIKRAIGVQERGIRCETIFKNLEQLGIISNLTFDSKLVSKKESIVSVPPLAHNTNTHTRKNNNKGTAVSSELKFAHDEVLHELNKLTDSKYTKSDDLLARLKDHTKEDCIAVVRVMVNRWQDDSKMSQFLRPTTLFRKSKFEEDYYPVAMAAIDEDKKMRGMFGDPNG